MSAMDDPSQYVLVLAGGSAQVGSEDEPEADPDCDTLAGIQFNYTHVDQNTSVPRPRASMILLQNRGQGIIYQPLNRPRTGIQGKWCFLAGTRGESLSRSDARLLQIEFHSRANPDWNVKWTLFKEDGSMTWVSDCRTVWLSMVARVTLRTPSAAASEAPGPQQEMLLASLAESAGAPLRVLREAAPAPTILTISGAVPQKVLGADRAGVQGFKLTRREFFVALYPEDRTTFDDMIDDIYASVRYCPWSREDLSIVDHLGRPCHGCLQIQELVEGRFGISGIDLGAGLRLLYQPRRGSNCNAWLFPPPAVGM